MSSLTVGDKAPDFTANVHTGEEIILSKVKSKFIILYFYPKDNTPGCTLQACSVRDSLSDLEHFGAKIFGVSKDTLKSHEKFVERFKLTFPLIVDENGDISKSYGVLKEKSMFGKKYKGIERTTFILDKNLKVVEIMEKVSPNKHGVKLVEKIKELG